MEIIVPEGDVVLVVDDTKTQLRVSSHILSPTSPVFKALLGPHFREGQQPRSSRNPINIALPEDYSEGMRIVCRLLHHNIATNDMIPGYTDMLEFAMTADKYDVVAPLYWPIRGMLSAWLRHHPQQYKVQSLAHIIGAAYVLGDSNTFKLATAQLFTHCSAKDTKSREPRDYRLSSILNTLAERVLSTRLLCKTHCSP